MKYEYKDLPNYLLRKDGDWEVYSYSRVLIPIPETEEETLALKERKQIKKVLKTARLKKIKESKGK